MHHLYRAGKHPDEKLKGQQEQRWLSSASSWPSRGLRIRHTYIREAPNLLHLWSNSNSEYSLLKVISHPGAFLNCFPPKRLIGSVIR